MLFRVAVDHLIKKFPASCIIWRFITVFTRALKWSYHPVHTVTPCFVKIILLLFSHLRLGLPRGLFRSGSLTTVLASLISSICATCPARLILLDLFILIFGEECKFWKLICSVLQLPVTWSLLGPDILCTLFWDTLSSTNGPFVLPLQRKTKFHTHTKGQVKL
jgi:hypothetical protein